MGVERRDIVWAIVTALLCYGAYLYRGQVNDALRPEIHKQIAERHERDARTKLEEADALREQQELLNAEILALQADRRETRRQAEILRAAHESAQLTLSADTSLTNCLLANDACTLYATSLERGLSVSDSLSEMRAAALVLSMAESDTLRVGLRHALTALDARREQITLTERQHRADMRRIETQRNAVLTIGCAAVGYFVGKELEEPLLGAGIGLAACGSFTLAKVLF